MCGRFGWFHSHTVLTERLAAAGVAADASTFGAWTRYNVAPTATAQIVARPDDGSQTTVHATFARWGLVPAWVRDPERFRASTFNARSDTVAEKPVFRDAFVRGRCLVPVSAFYEWRQVATERDDDAHPPGDAGEDDPPRTPTQGSLFGPAVPITPAVPPRRRTATRRAAAPTKQAMMIRRVDRAPLWLAGLHVPASRRAASPSGTFTIVTTSANPLLATVHARQPVILDEPHLEAWLDPVTPRAVVEVLMQPSEPADLEVVPIGPQIGQAALEGEALVRPVGDAERWNGADARPPWNARE